MATSVLNREIAQQDATQPIPRSGTHYTPPPGKDEEGRVLETTVQTIQGTPESLYALWSDLTSFPRWQEYVISVTPGEAGTSHWVMGNPEDADGKRVEFNSKIVEDIPGKRIAWQSQDEHINVSGTVNFTQSPAGRGTVVTLSQLMNVPGGIFGNAVAGIVARSPRQILVENLRHFKQLAEAGEIPSVKGQPHGPRGISGGIKEWLYGDTNPTPPGTSVQE